MGEERELRNRESRLWGDGEAARKPINDMTWRLNMNGKAILSRVMMALLMMGVAMNTNAGLFGLGGMSWKEEALLHDGNKIVVTRSHAYGGSREVGQSPSIKEQDISFTVPGTSQVIVWKDEYGKEVGGSNFILLALHILNNIPYVVARPNLCRSYNKWGQPNPPYVIFKHDGKEWQRVPLAELPVEFKDTNLSLVYTKNDEKHITGQTPITAEHIKKENGRIRIPESTSILREPVKPGTSASLVNCEELIYDGHGGWVGAGWFRVQPSYEACLRYCSRNKIETQHCPCNRFFKGGD
jgi:hypothetical protein